MSRQTLITSHESRGARPPLSAEPLPPVHTFQLAMSAIPSQYRGGGVMKSRCVQPLTFWSMMQLSIMLSFHSEYSFVKLFWLFNTSLYTL